VLVRAVAVISSWAVKAHAPVGRRPRPASPAETWCCDESHSDRPVSSSAHALPVAQTRTHIDQMSNQPTVNTINQSTN